MKHIILAAETGADIPPEAACRYGIYIVPMHVAFGDATRDDGDFPPEEVCSYQSARIAAEDRDYVTSLDTKIVTIDQYPISPERPRTW